MEDDGNMGVIELLDKTYEKLLELMPHETVDLGGRVMTEIADDSDWHRSRRGYMGYDKADLAYMYGNRVMIGRGTKCGSYPGDCYAGDLMIITGKKEWKEPFKPFEQLVLGKKPEEIQEVVNALIRSNTYFAASPLIGMSDGHLAVNLGNGLGGDMVYALNPELGEFDKQMRELKKDNPAFKAMYKVERMGAVGLHVLNPGLVAQEPEYNQELIDLSTFGPVNTRSMRYTPEAAEFLAQSLELAIRKYV